MSYIGRGLQAGAFRQLDDISSGFDGSDATHTMQVNSVDVTVGDVNQILLSLGGVVQKPGTDFTVASSVITFTTAPAANTSFFAILLGSDNGGTVTPTDASVTGGKLASDIAITTTGAANLNGGITMGGTTPTLTVGDAGAEDAKIVFDGNAQDFHIGLDDSADDLVIGVGSALGTTTAISITDGRAVTIGEAGIASSVAGIPFYSAATSSIYTHDVSGTDDSANYNTAYGVTAMDAITTGDKNTAIGFQTGSAITSGSHNVGIGYAALDAEDTGAKNIAIGSEALGQLNYNGDAYNIAIGYFAGNALTTGTHNLAIGAFAGYAYDAETHNVFIGYASGSGNIAGAEFNVGIGDNTLDALTSGDNNTAVGYNAGTAVTTGDANTSVGFEAGKGMTTGSNNTSIGNLAGQSHSTGDYCTNLGHGAQPSSNSTSGQFTLGDSNVSNLRCNDQSIAALSDSRDKTDVIDSPYGLDFINTVRPVQFKWETRDGNVKDGTTHLGFLAQELLIACDGNNAVLNVVLEDNPNKLEASYGNLITPLVKAVQELSATVTTLQQEINTLKGE